MAKVVHLTSVHTPFDPRIFHKECKTLVQAGYETVVIAPHYRDEVVDSILIRAVPKPKGRIERIAQVMPRVARAALEEDAALYHFHDPELIPLGLLLRLKGKSVIYDMHEDLPRDILSKHYLPLSMRGVISRGAEIFENLATRGFSASVTPHPLVIERLHHLKVRAATVRNFPLPDELYEEGIVPRKGRDSAVAYVGSITLVRGIKEMVTALNLLPSTLAVEMHLAGTYSPRSLRDEVAKQPGWQRVRELGYLDREGVRDMLSRVRAGLMVLHPEPNHVHNYITKHFEYMAAGIPVIASDFPLWREIIEGTGCGILVDPLDPQSIAHAIEYLITHPDEAEEMGRRGKKAVEELYNWDSERKKLLTLYEELLSK